MPCATQSLARLALSFVLLFFPGLACVSLDPLREQRFDEVTIETLEKAAGSDESAVHEGVLGLIRLRLESPESVDLDSALEALVCLRDTARPTAFDLLARCAREDTAEEVRFVALDALMACDAARAQTVFAEIATSDPSSLVREHCTELR